MTALLTPLVSSGILFCDLKTSSLQSWLWLWPDLSLERGNKKGRRGERGR